MNQRMLIVNDIPGAGKVAGNINLPIISASGIETLLLPTLILSTHTGGDYDHIVRRFMEDSFKAMLSHWLDNDIIFDSYLTGYFANPQQVYDFRAFLDRQARPAEETCLVVDPIMGDGGDFYDGFDHAICGAFQDLLPYCEVVLPNLTEACLMTQTPYEEFMSQDALGQICLKLRQQGARNVVITGIRQDAKSQEIGFFLVNDQFPQGTYISHRYFDTPYFGTGDIVASLVSAGQHHGVALSKTLEFVGQFIEATIESTRALQRPVKLGLHFEQHMDQVISFFKASRKKEG